MHFFLAHIDKVQLLFIFMNSFLLSRLLIVTKIPERLVLYAIGKQHLPITQIALYVIVISAALSFFIPNMITVLTLLPLIKLLCRTFEEALPQRYREIETLLPLALIYGANIGGLGSIVGTPANGIMVLYATLYDLPGTELLSFELWLAWGIPMVIALIVLAWAVLTVTFRLWNYQNDLVQVTFERTDATHPRQRTALTITAIFFTLSVLFSILMKTSSDELGVLAATGLSTIILLLVLFFPTRSSTATAPDRLLLLRDCYSNLPWRGVVLIGIILVFIGIGAIFHVQDYIIIMFKSALSQQLPLFLFYVVVAALTSFSTEIFSNTVVQIAMFLVVRPLFGPESPIVIQTFLVITFACTSAFMTPIATGVNGLAFGEMKGISLLEMIGTGFVMKVFSILIIAFGAPYLFSLFL
ncbi:hypothetical protein CSA56_16460 [candidate division KSB3 bacterium]|uniref:Citrate transporter-like domain-containing protein n=1 Tax=candidate division KSB3 bacterium TaxID=2044937 RepID=A0A2G6K920_9BACT|nr:MAG: hypothetical protein CSA56_16460 [candidate division KSB3 bacterium]